jgi:hypothetical protein
MIVEKNLTIVGQIKKFTLNPQGFGYISKKGKKAFARTFKDPRKFGYVTVLISLCR